MKRTREAVRRAVVSKWAEVLDVQEVTESSNFFEAGGDSLDAVDLVVALETDLGIPIDIGSLLIDGDLGHFLDEIFAQIESGSHS